jgi:hypothetical protein
MVLPYLLMQPFSFWLELLLHSDGDFTYMFHGHGCCSSLRRPFPVVWVLDGYSTLLSRYWCLLVCFFPRRNSWSEDEHSAWHYWYGQPPVVRVVGCMAWFLCIHVAFYCSIRFLMRAILRRTTIPCLQDFFTRDSGFGMKIIEGWGIMLSIKLLILLFLVNVISLLADVPSKRVAKLCLPMRRHHICGVICKALSPLEAPPYALPKRKTAGSLILREGFA